MAKKGVVIFDGEDMFINPKKAIYSKTRGEARNASFMSARGEDSPEEAESPIGRERIVPQETTSGGSGGSQVTQPTPIVTEPQPTIVQQSESLSKQKGVEPDAPITVSAPKAEVPTIVVPPILPPTYLAPVPETPQRPSRPGVREDDFLEKRPISDGSGGRYSGDENNPRNNTTPIFTIDDGSPQKPIIDTPRYVAPVPELPKPPDAVVIFDPLGGGGSPLLGDNKEVPKVTCPKGFVLNAAGICTPIVEDPCAGLPKPQLAEPQYGMTWKQNKKTCTWEQVPDGLIRDDIKTSNTTTTTTKKGDEILTPATSSTTTTTTKSTSTPDTTTTKAADKVVETSTTTTTTTKNAADKVAETTTSTTTTTTTTTKKSKNCNFPIYAPPRGTRWKDLGNCTFTTEVDPNFKDSAPVPTLPPTPGQPIININLPGGGVGTVPTLPTKPEPEPKPSGGGASGGGGGGGTPFPEEPAPVLAAAPKKNYFWWYVGVALAVYLLIKRKKSQ